jgi:hypothetical protein
MGFGIVSQEAKISRTTANSAQVAEKTDGTGAILEMTTYGAAEEISEEVFADSITNEATNGQVGNTSAGVVTAHDFIESNTEYQRSSKTTRKALATAATTTTT